MVYGNQQWPTIMRMTEGELWSAFRAVVLIKKAENEATEAERSKREAEARRDRERW